MPETTSTGPVPDPGLEIRQNAEHLRVIEEVSAGATPAAGLIALAAAIACEADQRWRDGAVCLAAAAATFRVLADGRADVGYVDALFARLREVGEREALRIAVRGATHLNLARSHAGTSAEIAERLCTRWLERAERLERAGGQ